MSFGFHSTPRHNFPSVHFETRDSSLASLWAISLVVFAILENYLMGSVDVGFIWERLIEGVDLCNIGAEWDGGVEVMSGKQDSTDQSSPVLFSCVNLLVGAFPHEVSHVSTEKAFSRVDVDSPGAQWIRRGCEVNLSGGGCDYARPACHCCGVSFNALCSV